MANKKFTILGALILFSLTFSACFQNIEPENQSPTEIIDKTEQTLSGTLKYLGSIGYKNAHYFLQLADDSVIYVIYDDNQLTQFQDLPVDVTGFFAQKENDNGDKAIFAIEKISLAQKETENSDTKNTNQIYEYLNPVLGVKFKFNSHWVLKTETTVSVTLRYENFSTTDNPESISALPFFSINLLPDTLDVNSEEDQNQPNDAENTTSFSPLYQYVLAKNPNTALYEVKIGPDNLNGVKVESSNFNTTVYLQRIKQIYRLEFQNPNSAQFVNVKNDFSDLLNNFQFIAINASAPSQTTEITNNNQTDSSISNSLANNNAEENTPQTSNPEPSTPEITNYDYDNLIKQISTSFNTVFSDFIKGDFKILRYEFIKNKSYAYVVYQDEEGMKKILLSYDPSNSSILKEEAYYQEGSTTDWTLSNGTDSVTNDQKEIYEISSEGQTTKTLDLQEGYSFFESQTYGFKMQYPKSWYFSSLGAGSYGFADQPIENSNQILTLKIVSGSIEDNISKTQTSADLTILYAKRNDTESYELSGPGKYKDQMQIMIESIVNKN
ncbi:hypothetical protein A2272_06235 [Candidatus Peregrinibacteria bacterium RIFOXYA12_FULL_33_12]|nr:MAG: hypothetical protein A2272_06235 [Candidatus Peregrinibacteria bacterium RIFOXYA12_FULL_33_12]OGJ45384.1 MAG: hypothetical protein A2263_03905 [Candidatus Peregrinibacteria bacterium RIFOXYA2_FULL_33_21]OGJ50987.1 MAG: hypothetical protein A2307_05500 [Candidatus Peregrinibacteria bacterium RIFOXYB2_FULL_33_20]